MFAIGSPLVRTSHSVRRSGRVLRGAENALGTLSFFHFRFLITCLGCNGGFMAWRESADGFSEVCLQLSPLGNLAVQKTLQSGTRPAMPLSPTSRKGAIMKFLVFATALLASPVVAQNCLPHQAMTEGLEAGFGETSQVQAMSLGQLVQIFANRETGTWTFVVTSPNGVACIVAEGDYYEYVGAPPGEPA